jgi:hypothetical protein
MRRSTAENRKMESEKHLKESQSGFFGASALDPPAFNPCEHPRHRVSGEMQGPGEQNESGISADSTAGTMAGNAKPQRNACLQIRQDADARRNIGSDPTVG